LGATATLIPPSVGLSKIQKFSMPFVSTSIRCLLVCPIGTVNEKNEGGFDVCQQLGLGGQAPVCISPTRLGLGGGVT
jgi:hypothetical protein